MAPRHFPRRNELHRLGPIAEDLKPAFHMGFGEGFLHQIHIGRIVFHAGPSASFCGLDSWHFLHRQCKEKRTIPGLPPTPPRSVRRKLSTTLWQMASPMPVPG